MQAPAVTSPSLSLKWNTCAQGPQTLNGGSANSSSEGLLKWGRRQVAAAEAAVGGLE